MWLVGVGWPTDGMAEGNSLGGGRRRRNGALVKSLSCSFARSCSRTQTMMGLSRGKKNSSEHGRDTLLAPGAGGVAWQEASDAAINCLAVCLYGCLLASLFDASAGRARACAGGLRLVGSECGGGGGGRAALAAGGGWRGGLWRQIQCGGRAGRQRSSALCVAVVTSEKIFCSCALWAMVTQASLAICAQVHHGLGRD